MESSQNIIGNIILITYLLTLFNCKDTEHVQRFRVSQSKQMETCPAVWVPPSVYKHVNVATCWLSAPPLVPGTVTCGNTTILPAHPQGRHLCWLLCWSLKPKLHPTFMGVKTLLTRNQVCCQPGPRCSCCSTEKCVWPSNYRKFKV